MRNPFSKASRDARMVKMQERADRIIAEQNAKGVAAQEEYARWQASQGGGGASVGGQQAAAPPSLDPNQPLPPIRDLLKQSLEYAKDSVGEMFDDRRDVLDPGDADLNKPPPELEDPAQREQWAADERAARDEARAPYLADTKPAVERTRFATTGRTQLEEVTERLKAFDPARVYGVYRVPDRYDLKRNNENKARVDWEIAHAPGAAGSSEVHLAAFNRADHWAVRRFGEPSVLDEDVAGALVARARLEPEDCFGLPRLLQVRATETEDSKFWDAHVEGILAFARKPLAAAQEQLLAAGAARARHGAAVPRRGARLGVGRRVGRAEPLHAAAHALAAAPPAEQLGGADGRLPGGRRRPHRGLLRRPGHPRRHQERPRRPLAGELSAATRAAATS